LAGISYFVSKALLRLLVLKNSKEEQFSSKHIVTNIPHLMAHILLTVTHCIMIYSLRRE
jgi:hypothetical protein